MTDKELDELERLEAAATPEWEIRYGTNVFGRRVDVGHAGSVASFGGHSSNRVDCNVESAVNAELAVRVRNNLKSLIADAREAQRLRAELAGVANIVRIAVDEEVKSIMPKLKAVCAKADAYDAIWPDFEEMRTALSLALSGVSDGKLHGGPNRIGYLRAVLDRAYVHNEVT